MRRYAPSNDNPDQFVPAPSSSEYDALPAGTRFGEFEIIRVLGVGGFGVVYLARDHSLERDVALKEYMPASLASRGEGLQITIRSRAYAETYAIGLRSFINEARLLARFDHSSLVKVYRFWEGNSTAYMVMPYLQGVTLRDARRAAAYAPDEAWIRSWLDPILDALELLHREGVYHRDIAPDNILLLPQGPPVLLDFGAARRVINDRTQSLTAILKPSYAPIEQYAEMTELRQGPWTDLYALGAVVHYLLFGVPPRPATARAVQGDDVSIANRSVPGVSPRMLEAVAWALAIRPQQRPQSVEEFRDALDGRFPIPQLGRQSLTLSDNLVPLAPLAGSAIAVSRPASQDQPLSSVESGSGGSMPPEPRPRIPAISGGSPSRVPAASDATPALSHPPAPVLPAPPAPVLPGPAAADGAGAARRGVTPAAEPSGSAVRAPAVRAAAPTASGLGYVFAGLGVVAVAAGVAIWLFGFPKSAGTADAPASSQVASLLPPVVDASPTVAVPSAVPSAPAGLLADGATATLLPPTVTGSTAIRPERTIAATSPSSGTMAAATMLPPAAASRPKTPPRSSETSLPPVADSSSSEYRDKVHGAGGRTAPPGEATPARPVAAAGPDGPSSAREACGGHVFLARAVCMDRVCEQPRFRSTAECIPILERKRARENR